MQWDTVLPDKGCFRGAKMLLSIDSSFSSQGKKKKLNINIFVYVSDMLYTFFVVYFTKVQVIV